MGLTISKLLSRLIAKKEMRILMVSDENGRRPLREEREGEPSPTLNHPLFFLWRAPPPALTRPPRTHARRHRQVGLDAAGKTTILYKLKLGGES